MCLLADGTLPPCGNETTTRKGKAMNLKEKLITQCNLKKRDFDTHESDLYVRSKPNVCQLLTELGVRFKRFINDLDGEEWLELPFLNEDFWERKRKLAAKRWQFIDGVFSSCRNETTNRKEKQ